VRVLRKDGDDKPEIKVFRSDKLGGEPVEVKVIGVDGTDVNRTFKVLLGAAGDEPAGKETYLGVAVEGVSPALAAQLPNLLAKDQGLVVTNVQADSPAAKAGLKEYDIIASYDDQKLLSHEQLMKLVRGDKPGREVTLSILRAGKTEKVKATLAEHDVPRAVRLHGLSGKMGIHGLPADKMIEWKGLLDPRHLPHQGELRTEIRKHLDERGGAKAGAGVKTRSNFLSLKLQSLDGDRFKAEVEFKNDKGETVRRSFEGTRDEIKKELEGDKEMPEGIRNQLRRNFDGDRGNRPGAFRFSLPDGQAAFGFSFDDGDFSEITGPVQKQLEQIFEKLPDNLDEKLREALKDALRSIEDEAKPAKSDDPSF